MSSRGGARAGKSFGGGRKHLDSRELKSFEIKRALTHRARLRKSYFKLLEKEGVPEPRDQTDETVQQKQFHETSSKQSNSEDAFGRETSGPSNDAPSDSDEQSDIEGSSSKPQKRHSLPPQDKLHKPRPRKQTSIPQERKQLSFAERAKIAKERKDQNRQAKLQEVQDRRRLVELKSRERELKKSKLTKSTKNGQPLMGPRINNLLDKIRKDNN